ncbi:methionyl-tRNA formyltransferase [Comamonas endophytica]|uniref:Methionyl-tRNA formyltransferase n=1 Tax=Comamonas endophytica TaxID=2949090 RepID=A0ABY6G5E1_9BURK|nr:MULTISPECIES: methionyl-tRNA formyltransferase [unclassified Acidovorax]MCD2512338.1 methionyl-tRNA formyltransferase [Acidovorax sp. D4N7]UYG50210.1 methionyl-tRNA formyltransferase [Acidovorax sp. 5MLIR]
MNVIFAGTPEFASVALQRLLDAGFRVPLVLTQPDRPAGRGMKLQASPVKQCALAHGIAVSQPRSLRLDGKYPEDAAEAQAAIAAAQADVMVVAAYGLILPQWVLDAPARGCLNIHASLLPRWRGAAPIHRAIEAGDSETGVTIMQMDAGLDTGDMCLVERLPIAATDTTASLHDELATLGGRLIVEALEMSACGGLPRMPQPAAGVTYAHKIEKAESWIDWRQTAAAIDRRVRAFTPFPGAASQWQGETIKFWEGRPEPRVGDAAPGTVLAADAEGVVVACGEGVMRFSQLQRAGGKRLAAADFLRGFALPAGAQLEAAP